ncbi:MAG: DUF2497 domain-containing protein [Pseudomonadota bacterium]
MGDVNHEPTMEEILASIKKIIAEDGDTPAAAPDARSQRKKPVLETSEPPVSDDVLELTDKMDAAPEVPSADVAEQSAEPIAADETVEASQAAFAALTAITKSRAEGSDAQESHPLEGLVREMLRPMLKEWLDENLPGLVEEMVAREIARIASGRD